MTSDGQTAADDAQAARAALLAARSEERVLPAQDDKVLTSWNAQMATALAKTGAMLKRQDFIDAAHETLAHLKQYAWRDGRLLASLRSIDGAAFAPIGPDPLERPLYLDADVVPDQRVRYRVTAIDGAEPPNESRPAETESLMLVDQPNAVGDD